MHLHEQQEARFIYIIQNESALYVQLLLRFIIFLIMLVQKQPKTIYVKLYSVYHSKYFTGETRFTCGIT